MKAVKAKFVCMTKVAYPDIHLEYCQTSVKEIFAKTLHGF